MLAIILIIGFQYILLLYKYPDSLYFKLIISLILLVPAILKRELKNSLPPLHNASNVLKYGVRLFLLWYSRKLSNVFLFILMSIHHILLSSYIFRQHGY